ncbi:MAG: hypothetical protein ACREJO_01555 [Phycisphaerales bacterium]
MLKYHRPADAPPTQERADAFDALTDLFLGEVTAEPIAGCTNSTVVAPSGGERSAPPPADEPLATMRLEIDRDSEAGAQVQDTINWKTVTREEAQPGEPSSPEMPVIELMVLGHLPLMGSAWAGQYVRHLAARDGSGVVVVRLGVGRARVELVDPRASVQATQVLGDFASAIHAGLHNAKRVVVQVSSSDDEPPRGCEQCDRITLLTSSDEAGVVAAYRLLKRLASVLTAGTPAEHDCAIGVAAMGCDETRAAGMWRRLMEAGQSFLGVHIEPAGCIERIDSGPGSAMLFDGAWGGGIAGIIDLVQASADEDAAAAQVGISRGPLEALEVVTARVAEVVAAATPRTVIVPPAKSPEPVAAVMPTASIKPPPAIAPADMTMLVMGVEPASMMASPAAPTPMSTTTVTKEFDLCVLVSGTTPMAARCPFDEDVQFAVDGDGRLHLMLLDHPHAAGEIHRTEQACSRLTAVGAWAGLNAKLLALTMPNGPRLDASRTPVSHLFTSSPAAARRLLDSSVRVHAMMPASAQVAGWVCASLN